MPLASVHVAEILSMLLSWQRVVKPTLNNAIKVMPYTRHFWFGVRCAWLVQRGTPYGGRYMPGFSKVFGFGAGWFSSDSSGGRNADRIVHRKCG